MTFWRGDLDSTGGGKAASAFPERSAEQMQMWAETRSTLLHTVKLVDLINTANAVPTSGSLGTVISIHKTQAPARAAEIQFHALRLAALTFRCRRAVPTSNVFISYSHDSVEHEERLLALAERLRADSVDVQLDQYRRESSQPAERGRC